MGQSLRGPPVEPFALPVMPPLADAEWFFLARYSSGGLCDASTTTDAQCCGLIREFPYLYSIARGDTKHWHVACEQRLVNLWRGDVKVLRAQHAYALRNCLSFDR